jgi:Peptidase A4 family
MRTIGHYGLANRCRVLVGGALTLILSAVLAGAPGPAPAARATAITAGARCGASVDPYSYPDGALAACGDLYYPVQGSYALPDGGTAYVYGTPGGATTFYVPRAGFNPFLASASVRAAYGLPAPPASGQARALWDQAASSPQFVDPGSFIVAVPAAASAAAKIKTMPDTWGGYNTTGKAVTEVNATWTEPKIVKSCPDSAEAVWDGLGYETTYLAQAGTGYDVKGIGKHQALWEIVEPDNGYGILPFPIKGLYATPGDKFMVQISKPSKSSASFRFLLKNVKTHKMASFAKSEEHDFGPTYAAAVVEWPWMYYKAVSNFGKVTFTGVEANERGFGAYNLVKNILTGTDTNKKSGTAGLAETSKLTDNSSGATFFVKYHAPAQYCKYD